MPQVADSTSRYRPITRDAFFTAMRDMGFAEIDLIGVNEHVFERVVYIEPRLSERFVVRIYSSVDIHTRMTREVGDDAIRVMLFDVMLDRSILDWRVFRTENALGNMRARAREAWAYALVPNHHCPECGAMMVRRDGRRGHFLGCTGYPSCKMTRTIPVPPPVDTRLFATINPGRETRHTRHRMRSQDHAENYARSTTADFNQHTAVVECDEAGNVVRMIGLYHKGKQVRPDSFFGPELQSRDILAWFNEGDPAG